MVCEYVVLCLRYSSLRPCFHFGLVRGTVADFVVQCGTECCYFYCTVARYSFRLVVVFTANQPMIFTRVYFEDTKPVNLIFCGHFKVTGCNLIGVDGLPAVHKVVVVLIDKRNHYVVYFNKITAVLLPFVLN